MYRNGYWFIFFFSHVNCCNVEFYLRTPALSCFGISMLWLSYCIQSFNFCPYFILVLFRPVLNLLSHDLFLFKTHNKEVSAWFNIDPKTMLGVKEAKIRLGEYISVYNRYKLISHSLWKYFQDADSQSKNYTFFWQR